MKKIAITFSIVLLGCLATNAQSNAPVMAAGKAGNAKTAPTVNQTNPQMAAYSKTPRAQYGKTADKPKPVLAPSAVRINKPKE